MLLLYFFLFTNQNIFDSWADVSSRITYLTNTSLNESQSIYSKNENDSQQYNFNYKHDFDEDGQNIELEVDHNIYDGFGKG